uniref:RNA polymerase Rpb4/RPC9 core domain-containing protein n=1 Tax=Florenciella parvula TaxID=236787 RepID=A0A7S2G293_9STRA|mmetsp:Transcript_28392/g.58200  ORF Transcript_28392/g.58200 Transcript_28392/m.58200 type:complete len:161 (+) Transcript_28392:176-658(+)|eukprot:CAMPEP_0119479324 /NCGR_PEP_ID=MMETSP1344-20130328/8645_1 /TAXON_ID=236787 /ORGANISM="Florenciella parvula, Strain CCMP2471" /LENGTH=160 /DNA_ID=CAMNT_0007513551 /DNA_START=195 /DNA_END=677 /DNA_ORIENTATION=-
MAALQQKSRDPDGGNVNDLNFGDEFDPDKPENQGMVFLSNQEVACILEHVKADREKDHRQPPSMMLESLDYVKRNCGVNAMTKIEKFTQSLRSRLEALEHGAAAEKLHKYEIAALFNLIQTDSEASEATELIPSLKRFDSEFIEQQVLEACQKEMEELMI